MIQASTVKQKKGWKIFWSQTDLCLLMTVWKVWMLLRGLWRNECRWWRGAGTPPNPAECTGMGSVGGCKEMDEWMDGCWRDDGERLNGSTWQLIERRSRVATLCNLLAGPWCMQAWYQQAWQTHAWMREQWGETSFCFHRLRFKKERKLFACFLCQGNCCSNFLHCRNRRLASSTPYTEIILPPLFWRLLTDLISAAATRLPDLTTNLGIILLITMLCCCGTYSLSFCVWQSERQWLVDVGLIQDALAAVCRN